MKNRFGKNILSLVLSAVLAVSSVSYISAIPAPDVNSGRDYQPMMAHASNLIGIDRNTLSERGEGTVIAVIDSSFDINHPIFSIESGVQTKISDSSVKNIEYLLYASRYYNASKYSGKLYVSIKIPFAYDYAEKDNNVSSSSSHGTHVAAVAAGNSAGGGQFDGVAPDAQLILLKVFYDDGTFGGDEMIADAVTDAIYLGADVINLSLGVSAGSSEYFEMPLLKRALEEAVRMGIVVVCAAGNDGYSGIGSTYDLDYDIAQPKTSYTDYGLVSEPSTLPNVISVAAANNEVEYKKLIYSNLGDEISYDDPSNIFNGSINNSFYSKFGGKTLDLVFVDGIGEKSDYDALTESGVSPKGKIAVVSRGTITFAEKITNAYNAGAAGIIIYNTNSGDPFTMQTDSIEIPAISISYEDGQKLLCLSDGNKSVLIPDVPYVSVAVEDQSLPAEFSSWGTTPELLIKPEITAVGSNIFSAVNNSEYNSMGGTSMASPMVAGASALVRSRLLQKDSALAGASAPAGANLVASVKAVLMNTASIITNEEGIAKSPRQQGAGLLNIANALSAETLMYFGKSENITPASEAKAELGADLSNEYTFPVTVYNSSENDAEYALWGYVQSDGYTTETLGESKKYFTDPDNPRAFAKSYITVDEETENLNRYASGSSEYKFTLAAGESRTFNITIKLDKSEFDEYNKIFTNGWFTEGFICVSETSGENSEISIPFMGYIGSWDDVPLFDATSYDGNDSMYPGQYVYAEINNSYYAVGTNLFSETAEYRSDLISFSPNRDGASDYLIYYISPLRNILYYDVEIISETGETVYSFYGGYIPKAVFSEDGIGYLIYLWDGSDGVHPRFVLPNGNYTCNIIGYGFSEVSQTISFPIILDTKKPIIDSYKIRTQDGKKYLDITASDTNYIQYAAVYLLNTDRSGAQDESKYLFIESYAPKYKNDARSITYSFDISDASVNGKYIYLEVVDYAMNTTLLRIDIE